MKLNVYFLVAASAAFLAACGGGGGDSAPAPAPVEPTPTVPAGPPPPYVVARYIPFSEELAFYVAGNSIDFKLSVRQAVPATAKAYLQVSTDSAVLNAPPVIVPYSDGNFSINYTTSASAPVGKYAGTVTVNICSDADCAQPLAGSPYKVPYAFEVMPPEGSLTLHTLRALSAAPGVKDWETTQGNAAHTGFVPLTLSADKFAARWRWIAPSVEGNQLRVSGLAISQGHIFVSSSLNVYPLRTEQYLHAFKEENGAPVWKQDLSEVAATGGGGGAPAVQGGKVFIVTGKGEYTRMFGFDAASGTQLYRSNMNGDRLRGLAPTPFDGTVYTSGGEMDSRYSSGYPGSVYAFNANTGVSNFVVEVQPRFLGWDGWTPAVDANSVYFDSQDGKLQIMDRRTGAKTGEIAAPTPPHNSTDLAVKPPVLGAAGTLFGGDALMLYSLNLDAKTAGWYVSGRFDTQLAYHGGTLYVPNNGPGSLEARRESDGGVLWSWVPPGDTSGFIGNALVTNNLVFVSTKMKTYAIDRHTHAMVWSYPFAGSLSLSANGVLYIQAKTSVAAVTLK